MRNKKTSLSLKGRSANSFVAAELVNLYGAKAVDRCCGEMLTAVRRELDRRASASIFDPSCGLTMSEWRSRNPEPEHGCGHMQGRGAA